MARFWKVDNDGWFVFSLEGGFTVRYDSEGDQIDKSEWMSPWQSYGSNEGDVYWNEDTANFLQELLEDCREAFAKLCYEWQAYCIWPRPEVPEF